MSTTTYYGSGNTKTGKFIGEGIFSTENIIKTIMSNVDSKVSKAGDTMSGDLNMGSNKVTNLDAPTQNSDAATKAYADTKVAKAGDTMTGDLNLGSNNIYFTVDSSEDKSGINLGHLKTALAGKLSLTGGRMSGAINMGSTKITHLATSTQNSDAVTKA